MPQPQHLDPGAYAADGSGGREQTGGTVGVLLIHGLTGSVAETRPMGEYLTARGLMVRCPLLPGHGTTPEDLIRVCWQAWAAEVESALRELQDRCRAVFVGGLSLGSLLTLWLGAEHPELAGLIPMAPAIKINNPLLPLTLGLRYVLKYDPFGPIGDEDLGDPEAIQRIWCYDKTPLWSAAEMYLLQRQVRRALPTIRQPILIFQGRQDAQLDPGAAQILHDAIGSEDKRLVWLEHSGHNLLVDGERESVWAQCYSWMMARAG
ncbi:MAG: alpha/beta fold hydrolase [Anaerolineae bacterium]|jgi:carboxylesterase